MVSGSAFFVPSSTLLPTRKTLACSSLGSVRPRAQETIDTGKVVALSENDDAGALVDDFQAQQQQRQVFVSSSAAALTNGEDADTTSTKTLTSAAAAMTDNTTNNNNNKFVWRGVVVVLCALWASNFAAIKLIVAEPHVDSSLYAVARFGLATVCLLPFSIQQLTRTTTNDDDDLKESSPQDEKAITTTGMDMETLQGAIVCGSWVAFGYIGQLLGLLTTTASKSCVICSLHCVFVAAVAEFWRSRQTQLPYKLQVLAPAALAVVGVSIVELWGAGTGTTTNTANIGDLLSFCQPIGFGMGYLQLEHLMGRRPDLALPVSAIKLAMVTLASLLYFEIGPWLQTTSSSNSAEWAWRLPDFGPILQSPTALAGVVYTGLVTTALALWIESIAFSRVSATTASLILTTEPLFAAGFGAIALGETFGGSDYVGAACIVGACVLATLMDNAQGDIENDLCIPDFTTDNDDQDDCESSRQWPYGGH